MNNEDKILSLLESMGSKIDAIDQRLDGMDQRLDGIDQRLDGVDGEIKSLKESMHVQFSEVKGRLDKVEEKLTVLHGSSEMLIEWADYVGKHTKIDFAAVSSLPEA